jgi:hypothetical protein
MEQTIIELVKTLLENPVIGPAIMASIRAVTGYLQIRWKSATGTEFSKGEFGATLLKYEVAINAIAVILPADFKYISAVVLVADILGSWGRKLIEKVKA